MNNKIKMNKKFLLVFLIICTIFAWNSISHAVDVWIDPGAYYLDAWADYDSGGHIDSEKGKWNLRAPGYYTGEKQVGSDNLDELFYYTVYNSSTQKNMNVGLTLYGPANFPYGSGIVAATDVVEPGRVRMYIYTVFAGPSSYDKSEIVSVDLVLNANGTVNSAYNFRSLMVVNMAAGEKHSNVLKERARKAAGNRKGFYTNDDSTDHYIQFLYSGTSAPAINIGGTAWTQSVSKRDLLGTASSTRQKLLGADFLDGFNNAELYTLYNASQDVNTKPWYRTAYVSGVATAQASATYHVGCACISYVVPTDDPPPQPPAAQAPNFDIHAWWNEPPVTTNSSAVRIHLNNVSTPGSSIAAVKIDACYAWSPNGGFGIGGVVNLTDGIYYADFNFNDIPNHVSGATGGYSGTYYFFGTITAANGKSTTKYVEVYLDKTPPTASTYINAVQTNANTVRVYTNATDDYSGISSVSINGFYGDSGGVSSFTPRKCSNFW